MEYRNAHTCRHREFAAYQSLHRQRLYFLAGQSGLCRCSLIWSRLGLINRIWLSTGSQKSLRADTRWQGQGHLCPIHPNQQRPHGNRLTRFTLRSYDRAGICLGHRREPRSRLHARRPWLQLWLLGQIHHQWRQPARHQRCQCQI